MDTSSKKCLLHRKKGCGFLKHIKINNCTYRLASACIANRLKKVLASLINRDQTGFLKVRLGKIFVLYTSMT